MMECDGFGNNPSDFIVQRFPIRVKKEIQRFPIPWLRGLCGCAFTPRLANDLSINKSAVTAFHLRPTTAKCIIDQEPILQRHKANRL